jgi:hypothetical protein
MACNPGPNGRFENYGGDDVIANLAGGVMPYASKWRVNLEAIYEIPLEAVDVETRAAFRHRSGYLTDVRQDPLTAQPATGVLDVSVRIAGKDGRHALELFVDNVTDSDTRIRNINNGLVGSNGLGGVTIFKSVPRDYRRYYGFRLSAQF